MIFIAGGAGFIGANFVHHWLSKYQETFIAPYYHFSKIDICDRATVDGLLAIHPPRAILHFAAESHVDRSIHYPEAFVRTSLQGTFNLLEATRAYWAALLKAEKAAFRFLHVSTDEVYGSLSVNDPAFAETTPYAPNSPYAASKAASDLFVRAWHHTYGFPTVTTDCSNNYGPYQSPENLIPLMIHNALAGKPLPIYGDGQNARDWLYVEDHCRAIARVLESGQPDESYNIGGHKEVRNIDVVYTLCDLLDRLRPRKDGQSYQTQITFVTDRPVHDRRYAIDASKIGRELGCVPQETFTSGLERSVQWYLNHTEWVEHVTSGIYRQWVNQHYGETA